MKKIIIASFLTLLVIFSLSAVSLDEIIQGAKELSPGYQNMMLSYENNLINVRSLELGDKVGISFNGSVDPLYEKNVITNPVTMETEKKKGINASGSVSVSLLNDGGTKIGGSVGVTSLYDGSDTSTSLSLNASHTFDFTGYSSSSSDDLTLAKTKYNTELSKATSELNFEKSVISTVSMILTYEKNIAKSKKSVEDQRILVEKMEALGTYSSSSPVYINAKNTLTQLEASLASSEKQYENAKSNYKELSGMDWDGLDEIPEPVLEVKTYENGNTSVLIKSLNSTAKREDYKATMAKLNPMNLSLSGNVSGNIASSNSLSVSGTIGYSGDNWSLSATPGVSVVNDKATPSLTISGSWSNGGTKNTSDEDTIKSATNSVLTADNEYRDALSSYYQEAQSLNLKVLSYISSLDNASSALEYAKMVAENEKAMFELGLSTERDVENAELNVLSAEYDMKIVMLDGLSLERDLKIFAL